MVDRRYDRPTEHGRPGSHANELPVTPQLNEALALDGRRSAYASPRVLVARHRRFAGLLRRWSFFKALLPSADKVDHPRLVRTAYEDVRPPSRGARSGRSKDEGERLLIGLIAPLCGERAETIAVGLIAHFGSLPAVLRSNRTVLASRLPDEAALVELLTAIRPLVRQLLLSEILERPVLADSKAAIDYLFVSLAHETTEQVHALFLDVKNRVIAQEIIARGSVSKVDLFPREIVRRALDLGATGLILAHNHPSGDPTPSRSDFEATRSVADAARLFDIVLHDHIVVGRAGWRSLRDDGYL